MMKRFWYVISEQDIERSMLSDSLSSINGFKKEPFLSELCDYQCNLRTIDDGNKTFYLLPFPYNFSTSMRGIDFYTTEELKEELKNIKWKHNQEAKI